MKSLNEYFLMVALTSVLNRIHVFCNIYVSFGQKKVAVKVLIRSIGLSEAPARSQFDENPMSLICKAQVDNMS